MAQRVEQERTESKLGIRHEVKNSKDVQPSFIATLIFKLSPVLGSRSEVLKTDMEEALEHLLLVRYEEENEINRTKENQLVSYKSMTLAAMYTQGSNNDLKKASDEHIENLSRMVGEAAEQQAQKRQSEYQWSPEVMAEMEKAEEGR